MAEYSELIDLVQRAAALSGKYENVVVARFNDHVVRMGRMTETYFWHFHPNSDETFIGVEGTVILELEGRRVELGPGQMFTVVKGVNLTLERVDMETVRVEVGGDAQVR
jgi:mannose-6-phosphate isomerase-like protein (cupin superfamily)